GLQRPDASGKKLRTGARDLLRKTGSEPTATSARRHPHHGQGTAEELSDFEGGLLPRSRRCADRTGTPARSPAGARLAEAGGIPGICARRSDRCAQSARADSGGATGGRGIPEVHGATCFAGRTVGAVEAEYGAHA